MPVIKHKIPTNIITGFLGVGKTTAIQQLISQKPEHETWGVLVNEFGQVGIDGALLNAFQPDNEIDKSTVVVKEVPGGCLCCVAGLAMKMGLNMLIGQAKPDRILIEPTGLGHLKQVVADLTGEYYVDVLDLQATICLVDPKHLQDNKYLQNDHFQDQVGIADILVANKTEQADSDSQSNFNQFVAQFNPAKVTSLWTSQGKLPLALLDNALNVSRKTIHLQQHLAHQHKHDHSNHGHDQLHHYAETEQTDVRFQRKHGEGQGLFTYGWQFNQGQCFDLMALASLLEPLVVERLKATLVTDQGYFVINSVDGECEFTPVKQLVDSRIEIISSTEIAWLQLEIAMCNCLIS